MHSTTISNSTIMPVIAKSARICGKCDFPAQFHGNDNGIVFTYGDGFTIKCGRQPENIGYATITNEDIVWRHMVMPSNGYKVPYLTSTTETFHDYYVTDGVALTSEDTSGPELYVEKQSNTGFHTSYRTGVPQGKYLSNGSYLDEQDYSDYLSEYAQIDSWRDNTYRSFASSGGANDDDDTNTETWVCTPTLEQHQSERMGTATEVLINRKGEVSPYENNEVDTASRNTYIENNPGFTSIMVLNEQLTERYHKRRVLNVFVDKQNRMRVGSIATRLDNTNPDEPVLIAYCVRNDCSAVRKISLDPNVTTRKDQEDFIYSMIAHGNNHAARWFTKRDTFYALHKQGCDLNCTMANGICTYTGEAPKPALTDSEVVAFLLDHNSICRDANCKCDERLEDLAPIFKALTATTAA